MSKESGFTLMEIMVCVAILGIAFTAVLKSTLQVQDSLLKNQFISRASALGANKMEAIRIKGIDNITSWRGKFENPPGYEWQLDVRSTQIENLKHVVLSVRKIENDKKEMIFEELVRKQEG